MREKGVIIAVSLLLGLVASGLFYAWTRGLPPFPKKNSAGLAAGSKKEDSVMVVMAAKDIPRRTKLTPEMLTAVEMPKRLAHPMAVAKIENVVNKFLQDDLIKGEIMLQPHIASKKAPSELTYAIPAGYRAATVSTSVPTGVANMIRPGDSVDVLLYVEAKRAGGADLGTTIMRGVLVLAIDKRMESWPGDTVQRVSEKMDNDGPEYQSVTLAVSPRDANMLVLAESIGYIKLTLQGADQPGFQDVDKEFQPVFVKDLLEMNGFDSARIAKVKVPEEKSEQKFESRPGRTRTYSSIPFPDTDPLPVVPPGYLNGAPGAAPAMGMPAGKSIYVMRGSELSTSLDGTATLPAAIPAPSSALISEQQMALKGVKQ